MDETGRKVLEGRRLFYESAAARSVVGKYQETQVALRAIAKGREMGNTANEVETWQRRSLIEAQALLKKRETEATTADNALALTKQSHDESGLEHQRVLDAQRLANDHELAKMGTMDLTLETRRTHELKVLEHEAALAYIKGVVRGVAVGAAGSVAIGTITAAITWMFC